MSCLVYGEYYIIDLRVESHENELSISNESRSGKTTISALLQKLYSIQRGDIFIELQNIRYINSSSLREYIATVPQQLNIFSGNIIENIALGNLNPSITKVVRICQELGILKFIEALPQGFETILGENGVGLSGGEK